MGRTRLGPPLRLSMIGLVATACALPLACGNPSPPLEEGTVQAAAGGSGPAGEGRPPTPGETPLPGRSEFVDNALRDRPATRAELRAALGAPDSVTAEAVPNRHVPGVMDTLYTVHYPDLTARFHHPGGGRDLLSLLQVSDDRHLRYPVVGLDVATIDGAFGPPDEASDSSLTYYCTTCEAGNDPVELVFVHGRVGRVRFNYYVD